MKIDAVNARRLTSLVFLVVVAAGCDQMEKVASGVGRATKSVADKVSKGIISKSTSTSTSTSTTTTSSTTTTTSKPRSTPSSTSSTTPTTSSTSTTTSGRNVGQYPRLPRSVTWKPISAASGDNLTIVLWGSGGGEKNYEKGSLRIEHNDGTKYPRTYVRRDDPDNGERAPKFYFDVRGSWFKGKDPVLFWNLGAYRVVTPEKRQGKHEGED